MSSLGEAIKTARESRKLTQEQLGQAVGVTGVAIMRYERNQRQPKLELLSKIAGALGTTVNDLIDGKWNTLDLSNPFPSDNIPTDNDIPLSANNIIPLPKTYKVPLLGTIACGDPILAAENLDGEVEVPDHINADFALRCKGDSMINARIFDGDIVYIRKQEMVSNGEIAAVLVDDDATLKRVYLHQDHIILAPENPLFPTYTYRNEDMNRVRILGKAVAFLSAVK